MAIRDRGLRFARVLPVVGALAVVGALGLTHGAAAQSAGGTVTGRVLWGACVRGIPLPLTPDGQAQAQPGAPAAPDAQPQTPSGVQAPPSANGQTPAVGQGQAQPGGLVAPDAQAQPGPGSRPIPAPISGLPAGAVLVAVQNTGVSARTDESGRFTLSGVPAGQYMTVAAGPVANSAAAVAERPNVFVTGGQTVDIGTLNLGSAANAVGCRFPLGVDSTTPGDAPTP